MNTLKGFGSSRIARSVVAFAAAVLTVVGVSFATAAPASAWPWSSHVHVAGHAGCNGFLYSPKLIQIWPGNGEYAQAGFNVFNNYGMDFYNISGPRTAWAQITCRTIGGGAYTYWRSFTIFRPAVGDQVNASFQG